MTARTYQYDPPYDPSDPTANPLLFVVNQPGLRDRSIRVRYYSSVPGWSAVHEPMAGSGLPTGCYATPDEAVSNVLGAVKTSPLKWKEVTLPPRTVAPPIPVVPPPPVVTVPAKDTGAVMRPPQVPDPWAGSRDWSSPDSPATWRHEKTGFDFSELDYPFNKD